MHHATYDKVTATSVYDRDVMAYDIRQTKQTDLPQILDLIHEFHDESLNSLGVTCDDNVASELMPKLVDTSMVLLVGDKVVGVIAGFVTHHVVNKEPLMQEVLWYVSKTHRRKGIILYREFEYLCKQRGMKHLVMVNMNNGKNDMFKRFYESEGFELLETQYIKNMEG